MDLSNLKVFAAVTKRMSWLAKRQEIVAQNIANADTPGYLPGDLKAQRFDRYLSSAVVKAELRKTQANHMNPMDLKRSLEPEEQKDSYEISPSGNAVVLEEQLMKINEVQGDFRLATNLYSKHVGLIRMALGNRGR